MTRTYFLAVSFAVIAALILLLNMQGALTGVAFTAGQAVLGCVFGWLLFLRFSFLHFRKEPALLPILAFSIVPLLGYAIPGVFTPNLIRIITAICIPALALVLCFAFIPDHRTRDGRRIDGVSIIASVLLLYYGTKLCMNFLEISFLP